LGAAAAVEMSAQFVFSVAMGSHQQQATMILINHTTPIIHEEEQI
jgi:hypothetical protein